MRRRRRSKVCLHPGRVFPPFFFFLADCRCDAKKNCNYRNTDRVPVALPSNGQGQMLMLVLMCVCVCVCVCMLLTERIRISCPPLATSSPPAASATSSTNSRDSPPLVLHPIIPWFQCKKKTKQKNIDIEMTPSRISYSSVSILLVLFFFSQTDLWQIHSHWIDWICVFSHLCRGEKKRFCTATHTQTRALTLGLGILQECCRMCIEGLIGRSFLFFFVFFS